MTNVHEHLFRKPRCLTKICLYNQFILPPFQKMVVVSGVSRGV